jgi:quinol monooxygenase YgiN
MILVVARLRIRPGAMTPMLAEVEALARLSRTQRGCHEYMYLRSPEDDDLLLFVERWEDQPSLAAHLASMEMAEYRKTTASLVAERSHSVFDAKDISL